MRVFISADIEGISGVVNKSHTSPQGHDYHRARTLMTNEVNAAIEGAIEAGAQEIVVNDSHGPMTNILLESLNPKASLITGTPKKLGMMEGIDSDYDAVFLVGYHGRMNTPGVLSHSYYGIAVSNITINGKDAGEFFINAAVAGFYKVPVVLVTGDNVLSDEVGEVNPKIERVIVKEARGRYTAKCLSPELAHKAIKEKTKEALKNLQLIPPVEVTEPITMEVSFLNSGLAEAVAIMPGFELSAPNKITYKAPTIIEAYRGLMAMTMIVDSIL